MHAILNNTGVVLIVILFFGVTIFVHEFGHYLAARLLGLAVDTFSIGFGPAIWKRRHKGILYKIGCIPFGGYVALPQLDPTGMAALQGKNEDGTDRTLPPVAAWRKIVVSVSGALGNVLLAVALAWLVFAAGMPATTANEPAVLGYVRQGSPAYAAGLRTGDRVCAVDGVGVERWGELIQEVSLRDEVNLRVVDRGGAERTVTVPTETWEYGIQMISGVAAREPCKVGAVTPGMSAEAAGIEAGDVLVTFDGEEILSPAHLIDLVGASRDRPVELGVEREAEGAPVRRTMTVTPTYDAGADMVRIGIQFAPAASAVDPAVRVHPRPGDQLRWHASAIFRFLGNLVSPDRAGRTASQMGGPVMIVSYYIGLVKASLMLAVWFTGFLNINLAILNLLPIPVLDGGHVLFSLWELVARRPLKPIIVNTLVNVFVVLFIAFFIYISVRDVDRTTPVGRFVRERAAELWPAEAGSEVCATNNATIPSLEGSAKRGVGSSEEQE
jgi:regulator of sigma E protease